MSAGTPQFSYRAAHRSGLPETGTVRAESAEAARELLFSRGLFPLEVRLRGDRVADLAAFVGSLSPTAREQALRRFPDLVGVVVTEPEAWIVTAQGAVGVPPAISVLEVRLVRAGDRAAIVRCRT